jgi:hypothetical protein
LQDTPLKSELRFSEIIRMFLAHGLIPEYATAVARVMHVKPLRPVRTASWLLFSASSVGHYLGTTIRSVAGQASPSPASGLINLSCFLLFRKNENALHAKSAAQSRTFVQSIRSNSNPKIHYPPQCLLQHRKSRLPFVWITPPALRRFRGP